MDSGKLCSSDFALNATLAESSRHQDRIHVGQLIDIVLCQALGIDVLDFDARAVFHARMPERFVQ